MPWMQLELFVCKSVALHELASFLLPEVEPEPDPLGLSPPEDLHPVSCEEYAAVADFIMLLNWVWREAGQGARVSQVSASLVAEDSSTTASPFLEAPSHVFEI